MPPRKLTAKDIEDWPTPDVAARRLNAAYGDRADKNFYIARRTLLDRLRAGVAQAVSGHSVFEGSRHKQETFLPIPPADWKTANENHLLWVSGDFIFQTIDENSAWKSLMTISHFGVKLEPQGVQDIIKSLAPTVPQDDGSETKAPRVSDAHLAVWYEFYKATHSVNEDTEDRAVEFARQCFPGKSVSRDRIRALRGAVKRGPKPKG